MALTTALAFLMLGAATVGVSGEDAIPASLLASAKRSGKPMNVRKRFLFLTLIMVGACAMVMAVMTTMLYRHDINEHREHLQTTAQSQARLIEAVARYDARMAKIMWEGDLGHDASAATLSQIIDAHERYEGFGETGEFTLARRDGDTIVFTLRHRHGGVEHPAPMAFDSELAEPMRRALNGLSGTVIGLDYRGETVLAAYEPVAVLNLGIVAKIDLAEIRVPFIRSGLLAVAVALLVVLAGTALFFRVGNPIIARLEAYSRDLEKEVEEHKQVKEAMHRHNQELTTLLEVSKTLVSTLNMETVLQATTESIARYMGLEISAVYLLEGDKLYLGATTPPLPPEMPDSFHVALLSDHPHIEETISKKQTKFILDTKSASLSAPEKAIIEARNVRSLLYIPLIAEEKVIGVLLVGSMGIPRDIADSEIEFCSTLANIASLAIANTQLYKASQSNAADLEREVTERKQAEKTRARLNTQLKAKNKELEQIISVASHDLRSPLVNIDGYGKELEHAIDDLRSAFDSDKTPAEALEAVAPLLAQDMPNALRFIRTSTSKMDALLAGLLKLSRSGRAALTLDSLDMNELIGKVVNASEFQIKEAGPELDIADLPPCKGDAVQVNQVFSNLLGNALQYLDSERPGAIRISGRVEGERSVYCVEDNGIGIAPAHRQNIFEIFHRLDPAKSKGEGLGLTIVQQILARLSGAVWVESKPGEGSRFYVALPAVQKNQ